MSALALAALGTLSASAAAAQDAEVAGQSRRGYAWGEAPSEDSHQDSGPARHRFADVYASLGAGASIRLYYDDRLPSEGGLGQEFVAPAYLQLRGGFFFEGDGDLQHGVGLGLSTNLMADPQDSSIKEGFFAFGQWTVSPQYLLRVWLMDEFQVLAHVGVPVAIGLDYTVLGAELGGAAVYKFLNGLGVYADLTFSTYFAEFAQPLLSLDAGLVFDYEVLP